MRAVVQRVSRASVRIGQPLGGDGCAGLHLEVCGEIATGLLVLLGVAVGDVDADADWMAEKVVNLRIFPDDAGKMNRSVLDIAGGVLAVSQFTLLGDARRGRRPEFTAAARPEVAEPIYKRFCNRVAELGVKHLATGVFREHMGVELVNDGPVTLILDSPKS